jgi:GxxExxY protein
MPAAVAVAVTAALPDDGLRFPLAASAGSVAPTPSSVPSHWDKGDELNRQDAKYAKKNEPSDELDELVYAVNGAALEVHRRLGPGFLESVYEESLCIELGLRGIPFVRQMPVAVNYKGYPVGEARLDLLVDGRLVVELKAVDVLLPIHHAQVISYLRATGCRLGLPINFNVALLKTGIKRIILS